MADPHNTILHRWFDEVWNQGNTALIDEFFPADRVAYGLREPQGDAVRGAAEYRAFYDRFHAAFPDIHIEIEDSMVDGDRIAVRCLVTGTHTGPACPSPPPANRFASPACAWCALRVARPWKAGTVSTSWRCIISSA